MVDVTNRMIVRYLTSHDWFHAYKKNLLDPTTSLIRLESTNDNIKQRCLKYLLGMKKRNTFMNAFTWRETPEGHNFWREVHHHFLDSLYDED